MNKKEIGYLIGYFLLCVICLLGISHLTLAGLLLFWATPFENYMDIYFQTPLVERLFGGLTLWMLLMAYVGLNIMFFFSGNDFLNIILREINKEEKSMKLWNELTKEEQEAITKLASDMCEIIDQAIVEPLVELFEELSWFFDTAEGILKEEEYQRKKGEKENV